MKLKFFILSLLFFTISSFCFAKEEKVSTLNISEIAENQVFFADTIRNFVVTTDATADTIAADALYFKLIYSITLPAEQGKTTVFLRIGNETEVIAKEIVDNNNGSITYQFKPILINKATVIYLSTSGGKAYVRYLKVRDTETALLHLAR